MSDKIFALMVAAGSGSRFGSSTPKQYLKVAGKTVLEHSIDRLSLPQITDLTLVLSADDKFAQGLPFAGKVHFALGGAERFLSVLSGIDAIKQRGAQASDWILIHDAVRPCVSIVDVQRLIETAVHSDDTVAGAILATPVVDTLKFVQNEQIQHTINRQSLWQAQTPQMFRLADLEAMFATVLKEGCMITDEASGFELLGRTVKVVAGSKLNLKLTYPEDLAMIELILKYGQFR